jgi:LacI family transcriptional regulator, galactose operon repressor
VADPPTAVFVANNQMTIGVMRALADLRVRVPEQLAMVVFDDFEWADLFHPRLTAAAQPIPRIGERVVQLLLSRIEDPSLPVHVERLDAELVHRESCGCTVDRHDLAGRDDGTVGRTDPWVAAT